MALVRSLTFSLWTLLSNTFVKNIQLILSNHLLFVLINIVQEQKTVVHNTEDIGRSKGGLSTKIHGVVDALDNPTNFF